MNINKYIKELQRGAGADRALKIAQARAEATRIDNWNELPAGYVFFPNDARQKHGYREKELTKLHNFWVQVYNIMRKNK